MAAMTTTLSPPDGWIDKTMIVHSAPHDPASPMAANIVVSRDALLPDETFAAYCDRQDGVFRDNLPGYRHEDRRAGILQARAATQIAFTWTSSAGPLRQQATFIDAGGGVVVGFTASAAADDFEKHRDLFNRQLAALRIEATSAEPPAAG